MLPPGAPEWQHSATSWLLDLCPPDYRRYDVLRRHPVVLARFAAEHVSAGVAAGAELLSQVRVSLRGAVPPEAVEAAVTAVERESARLQATARAVALVESALRGATFRPRL